MMPVGGIVHYALDVMVSNYCSFVHLEAKEYQILWNPYYPYTCDAIFEN